MNKSNGRSGCDRGLISVRKRGFSCTRLVLIPVDAECKIGHRKCFGIFLLFFKEAAAVN